MLWNNFKFIEFIRKKHSPNSAIDSLAKVLEKIPKQEISDLIKGLEKIFPDMDLGETPQKSTSAPDPSQQVLELLQPYLGEITAFIEKHAGIPEETLFKIIYLPIKEALDEIDFRSKSNELILPEDLKKIPAAERPQFIFKNKFEMEWERLSNAFQKFIENNSRTLGPENLSLVIRHISEIPIYLDVEACLGHWRNITLILRNPQNTLGALNHYLVFYLDSSQHIHLHKALTLEMISLNLSDPQYSFWEQWPRLMILFDRVGDYESTFNLKSLMRSSSNITTQELVRSFAFFYASYSQKHWLHHSQDKNYEVSSAIGKHLKNLMLYPFPNNQALWEGFTAFMVIHDFLVEHFKKDPKTLVAQIKSLKIEGYLNQGIASTLEKIVTQTGKPQLKKDIDSYLAHINAKPIRPFSYYLYQNNTWADAYESIALAFQTHSPQVFQHPEFRFILSGYFEILELSILKDPHFPERKILDQKTYKQFLAIVELLAATPESDIDEVVQGFQLILKIFKLILFFVDPAYISEAVSNLHQMLSQDKKNINLKKYVESLLKPKLLLKKDTEPNLLLAGLQREIDQIFVCFAKLKPNKPSSPPAQE